MANPFLKDFDTILNEILTDYANLDSQPDTSVGGTPWIMASVLTSIVWGLYKYQDYISQQHFPDTADTDNLNHWGSVYGISRNSGESDSDYLDRILAFIRQPSAGGNAQDYETWAKDQDECLYGYSSDTTYYNNLVTIESNVSNILGTVGVYCVPTDETDWRDSSSKTLNVIQGLRANTQTYIDGVRPLGLRSVVVFDTTYQNQVIDIDVYPDTDGTVTTTDVSSAIYDFLYTLKPGETLYTSNLNAIAINYGADHATVNTPAADVEADSSSHYIRPYTITITYQG